MTEENISNVIQIGIWIGFIIGLIIGYLFRMAIEATKDE